MRHLSRTAGNAKVPEAAQRPSLTCTVLHRRKTESVRERPGAVQQVQRLQAGADTESRLYACRANALISTPGHNTSRSNAERRQPHPHL